MRCILLSIFTTFHDIICCFDLLKNDGIIEVLVVSPLLWHWNFLPPPWSATFAQQKNNIWVIRTLASKEMA